MVNKINICAPVLLDLSQMNFPISMDRTSLFQILGVLGGIFIQILIEYSVSKQCRPLTDAASDLGLRCFPICHKKESMC